MTLHDMLPKQREIEDFLGRDFFPSYSGPMTLKETVDMVQLQFCIPDEARALPVPRGHASTIEGGTILECLTHFAMLRLHEKGYLLPAGLPNTFQWKGGMRYIGKVSRRQVNEVLMTFRILRTTEETLSQALTLIKGRWPEDVIQTAVREIFPLTREAQSV